MQLNAILPSKSLSRSRTTPTFTGIDVFSAIPIPVNKIFTQKKKKERTAFEWFFFILMSTYGRGDSSLANINIFCLSFEGKIPYL
jgi:hypothetical protein